MLGLTIFVLLGLWFAGFVHLRDAMRWGKPVNVLATVPLLLCAVLATAAVAASWPDEDSVSILRCDTVDYDGIAVRECAIVPRSERGE